MNFLTILKAMVLSVAVTAQTPNPSAHLGEFDLFRSTVYVYPDKTNHLDYYPFVDKPLDDHNTAMGTFDWDINLTYPLRIINESSIVYDDFHQQNDIASFLEAIEDTQGKFILLTNYSMFHRHYSIEVLKKDCESAIDVNPFFTPMVTNDVDNTTGINEIAAYFFYLQKSVQESDIWTSTKTGGIVEFCVKVTNYLAEEKEPDQDDVFDEWGVPVTFNETVYTITVDSLTDFETTIDIERTGPEEGFDTIDYEDDIEAYTCDSYYNPISLTYSQGDFVNICVETVETSKFEVHSIKDLTVAQIDDSNSAVLLSFDYVDNFVDSRLASSTCIDSNTTSAICKTKLQLIAGFFIQESIDAADGELDVYGTVKLDFLGRRLSMDIPMNLRLGDESGRSQNSRSLDESSKSFDVTIGIEASEMEDENSGFFSRDLVFTTLMSFIASFMFLI